MASPFDDLLTQIPISDIAARLGIDPSVAESAVRQVLPTLVGGMAANAQSSDGEAALEKALATHQGSLDDRKRLDNVDTGDGQKIVNHVFGAKRDDVVSAVSGSQGVAQDIIAKILPIVAPIALAWLASRFLGDKASAQQTAPAPQGSGGLADMLGGLIGGLGGSPSPAGNGGGDLLGGLLGGLLSGKN